MSTNSQALDALLKKTKDNPSDPILPDELSYLITAFVPSQTASLRSKAYLVLSAFCQGVRNSFPVKGKQPDSATEALTRVFRPLVLSRLEDTEESILIAGISFLTALFQVDWDSASSIFQDDGVLESVMYSVDLTPSLGLSLQVAHLLGQACGHKPCRAIITPQTIQWLSSTSRNTKDTALRAATTITLVKLSKGNAFDSSEGTGSTFPNVQRADDELAQVMKGLVINGADQSSIADAVEGLAYLSADPVVKEALANDSVFLQRLFSLVPRRKALNHAEFISSTLLYGILLIISNICAYRPRLTEEQAQVENLRRMANADKAPTQASDSSVLDDDANVKARIRELLGAGVLDVFAAAVPGTDSLGVKVNVGKALLSIVEEKENRGRVLQSGGAKILSLIIKTTTSDVKTSELDSAQLQPIQALAKLSITSSPVQVFGPNEGAIYDATRPFSILLQHPSSSLLQRFEALMALTNLSSASPEAASRIARADGLMNKVDLLLLEEHVLVRRAAMELVCNLIAGSDEVFERYGGTEKSSKSKVQVILALSDVEDMQTRLAASGALAILTAAPSACQALLALQLERHRALPILAQLIDPSTAPDEGEHDEESDPGLIHRGVICARNFLLNISDEGIRKVVAKDAEDAGLKQALVNVVEKTHGNGTDNEAILGPATVALKFLLETK